MSQTRSLEDILLYATKYCRNSDSLNVEHVVICFFLVDHLVLIGIIITAVLILNV